ncbi:hypothetical protein MYCOZU2_03867 [Mycobacterium intracellulare subsp. chimaera]|uniref:Uncharacterized protein n=1 Tax=Mycobacterium intracellulare subsp. chimaera TaxID=222805 RepID=A0A7U5MMG6_MYCIT|nr:hypothetical protein MYCOZU2_03867 [Mycobacterium intracellulare subsp. chimaera]
MRPQRTFSARLRRYSDRANGPGQPLVGSEYGDCGTSLGYWQTRANPSALGTYSPQIIHDKAKNSL